MWYVYIILSLKTKEFYKGITNNIDRRLSEHFLGKTKFSKNRLPLKLIHVEIYNSRIEARQLDEFFKSGYGREIIKELV